MALSEADKIEIRRIICEELSNILKSASGNEGIADENTHQLINRVFINITEAAEGRNKNE